MRSLALLSMLLFAAACGGGDTKPDGGGGACSDGTDNDGDGTTDFPDDLGCQDAADDTEDSPASPQCGDGRDNDSDGKVDYPDDPGCVIPQADSEADDCPDGTLCPQCSNGKDDDANGAMDYPDDVGCESAGDTLEFTTNTNACGPGMNIQMLPATGMAMGMLDGRSTSTIVSPCGGGGGAAAEAYVFHINDSRVLVASTDNSMTQIDTVLDLRGEECAAPGSELACNDDIDGEKTTSKITKALDAGTYYLIVEGHDTSSTGPFQLTTQLLPGRGTPCTMPNECGPGLVCRVPTGQTAMVCTDPVCSDGADEDGDTKIDYPLDPGCESPDDDTEADTCPSGVDCPHCANGKDDDADTKIDYPMDTACQAASGGTEACNAEMDPVRAIGAKTINGTLAGAHDDLAPTASCGSSGGNDVLFTLTLPALDSLKLDTETSEADTVLRLLNKTCVLPAIACDDDGGTSSGASLLDRTNVAAGTYIVAVDGYNSGANSESFVLHIAGVIKSGAKCDSPLVAAGALTCAAGTTCQGAAGAKTCKP